MKSSASKKEGPRVDPWTFEKDFRIFISEIMDVPLSLSFKA
jgi:hypothetical protein